MTRGIGRSRQQLLEDESIVAVQRLLLPWTLTLVDGRHDIGRDGIVQVFDINAEGSGTASPLFFAIQVRAHDARMETEHRERPETRHLKLWRDGDAPTLLAVWSAADGEVRVRGAKSMARELDQVRPGWEGQDTASVRFGPEHSVRTGEELRARMRRLLADESDVLGGQTRFHRTRRRVLLLDLIMGTVNTSQRIGTEKTDPGDPDPIDFVLGPGWRTGEIHPADVYAPRVLATALLLFEEVWLPVTLAGVLLRALPVAELLRLLAAGRIVPFASTHALAFGYRPKETRGSIILLASVTSPWNDAIRREVEKFALNPGDRERLAEALVRHSRVLGQDLADRVLKETKNDLQNERTRQLLGLSPTWSELGEPVWDSLLVNRLAHMNLGQAVASECSVDVVEYEAGLSRVATDKWFSSFGFHRLFPSSDAFDRVLRGTGTPDLGAIEAAIGLGRVVEIAESDEGGVFREWFWSNAATLVGSGARVDEILRRFEALTRESSQPIRTAVELKLRFFEKAGSDYIVGALGRHGPAGFAARAGRGDAALDLQRAFQARERTAAIAARFGHVEAYAPCPCLSGARFRFCCGPARNRDR
jgi:hypothetical protein